MQEQKRSYITGSVKGLCLFKCGTYTTPNINLITIFLPQATDISVTIAFLSPSSY
jgi:hypothetical protein